MTLLLNEGTASLEEAPRVYKHILPGEFMLSYSAACYLVKFVGEKDM
jgi:hypothetical protein